MENLKGNDNCVGIITQELGHAGINMVNCALDNGELAFPVIGVLGELNGQESFDPDEARKFFKFTFVRARDKWLVRGCVPLHVAVELYNNPLGKEIRVHGNCGHFAPDCKIDGRYIYAYSENGEEPSIFYYHIDSQEALNLFVQAIKLHGLDK